MTLTDVLAQKSLFLFDLFHTLTSVNTQSPDRPATASLLGLDARQWNDRINDHSRARLVGQWTDPVDIIRRVAHGIDPTVASERIERAARNRTERFREALLHVPEETVRVLGELRSRGKRIGLVSNADLTEIIAWPESPLAPFFDHVVFSCHVGMAKPEAGIYRCALERFGARPEEAVFIGDGGAEELRGAKELGLTPIMVTGFIADMPPERLETRRFWADFVIDGLSELLPPE